MILTLSFFSIVFLATLLAGLVPLFFPLIRQKPSLALYFSAGILISASFLHLIPEAVTHLGRTGGLPFLIGFLFLFVMEKFFLVHPCEEDENCHVHPLGFPAFVGISIHALVDGIALGTGIFMPELGMIVLLGIVFHKIPAAFSLSTILLAAKFSEKRIKLLVLLFSLATPIGGIIALYGLKLFGEGVLGWALGISAGTFLAIATSDLVFHMHTQDNRPLLSLTALFLGIFVPMLGLLFSIH